MMTRQRKSSGTTERVRVKTGLTGLEEQVVRMRHGLKAPAELTLEDKAGDNLGLRAELRAMEQRALQAVAGKMSPTKRKIVSALRSKKS
jgi:hypothetical protein